MRRQHLYAHRWVHFPPPSPRRPIDLEALASLPLGRGGVEILRAPDGKVFCAIAGGSENDLARVEAAFHVADYEVRTFAGGGCLLDPLWGYRGEAPYGVLVRVEPLRKGPAALVLDRERDYATSLYEMLSTLGRGQAFFQLLFDRKYRYHDRLEIRAILAGPGPDLSHAVAALRAWTDQFWREDGGKAFRLRLVADGLLARSWRFFWAMQEHDITVLKARPSFELHIRSLGALLPFPWKRLHPELDYAGGPPVRPPPAHRARSPGVLGPSPSATFSFPPPAPTSSFPAGGAQSPGWMASPSWLTPPAPPRAALPPPPPPPPPGAAPPTTAGPLLPPPAPPPASLAPPPPPPPPTAPPPPSPTFPAAPSSSAHPPKPPALSSSRVEGATSLAVSAGTSPPAAGTSSVVEKSMVAGPDLPLPPLLRLLVGISVAGEVPVELPGIPTNAALLGKTRSGKSTLVQDLVLQMVEAPAHSTVIVVDKEGSLNRGIVSRLSLRAASRSVELDPTTNAFEQDGVRKVALGFNVLAPPPAPGGGSLTGEAASQRRELVVDQVVSACKDLWGTFVGPVVEHMLRPTLRGLSEIERTTLYDAYLVLNDPAVRDQLLRGVRDPMVRQFLDRELPSYQKGPQRHHLLSTLDKLERFLTSPMVREVIAQRTGAVAFERLLQERLVLLTLPQAGLGEDNSRFLGSLLLTMIAHAVEGRSEEEGRRSPVYLVIDEFQHFAFPGLARLLSEGAKHGIHVVLASQSLAQVEERTASAIRANVGTLIAFTLGEEDAALAAEMTQARRAGVGPESFLLLDRFHAIVASGKHLYTVETFEPTPCSPEAERVREVLLASTRRFACEETSLDSPFVPVAEALPQLLEALEKGPMGRETLASHLSMDTREVHRLLRGAVREGLVAFDPGRKEDSLTSSGRWRLEALRSRRSGGSAEGEAHTRRTARWAAWMEREFKVRTRIVPQKAGVRLPDAEFERDGAWTSVEVESSNLVGHPHQVVRNVEKAVLAGRACVVVVEDRSRAEQASAILAPEASRFREGVHFAIYYEDPEDPLAFLRYPSGQRQPPFLLLGEGPPHGPGPSSAPVPSGQAEAAGENVGARPLLASAAPNTSGSVVRRYTPGERAELRGAVRRVLKDLKERGTGEVDFPEIASALPEPYRDRSNSRAVGDALKALAVPSLYTSRGGVHRTLYWVGEGPPPWEASRRAPTVTGNT